MQTLNPCGIKGLRALCEAKEKDKTSIGGDFMAIYHFSTKTISRSTGRTASGSAAYRSGEDIQDATEAGLTHSYRRKEGILYTEILLPTGVPAWSRQELWNAADLADRRKNSCVGREYEIALPAQKFSHEEREELTRLFALHVVNKYGVAVDFSIHKPEKKNGEDSLNFHAHIMTSTRVLTPDGFGKKTRVLDDMKTRSAEINDLRQEWENILNKAFFEKNIPLVSCKSFRERGLSDLGYQPTVHVGPDRYETKTDLQAKNDRRKRANQAIDQAIALDMAQEEKAAQDLTQEITALEAEIPTLEAATKAKSEALDEAKKQLKTAEDTEKKIAILAQRKKEWEEEKERRRIEEEKRKRLEETARIDEPEPPITLPLEELVQEEYRYILPDPLPEQEPQTRDELRAAIDALIDEYDFCVAFGDRIQADAIADQIEAYERTLDALEADEPETKPQPIQETQDTPAEELDPEEPEEIEPYYEDPDEGPEIEM